VLQRVAMCCDVLQFVESVSKITLLVVLKCIAWCGE